MTGYTIERPFLRYPRRQFSWILAQFLILALVFASLACGARRRVDQAEPTPPEVRGVVSSQKTDWQGLPSSGITKSTVVNPLGQTGAAPNISIFFIRQSLTTSDSDDFSEETEIKSWFGPEAPEPQILIRPIP